MEITTFKTYGQDNYILFDGSHYAIYNNFNGLYAYTESITRSEDYKSVDLVFIIPDLLPTDKTAIKKAINKCERRYCSDKKINYVFKVETPKAGSTTINNKLMFIGLKDR